MRIQKLVAILVAVAVAFAPAFTRAGQAWAAVADHHPQMLEAGHCEDAAPESTGKDGTAKDCCVSMCTGVAVTCATAVSDAEALHSPAVFSARPSMVGLPAEIATPPPRSA